MYTLPLPPADIKGSITLEQTIFTRASKREFKPDPLPLTQISQMLWAAQGKSQAGFRTAPSAGGLFPLEIFTASHDGIFQYQPADHSLKQIIAADLRKQVSQACFGQGFIAIAPLTIIITAEFARTTDRYGERGVRYVYLEAGHCGQNIYLQAVSRGLGCVAIGAFDDQSLSQTLELPGHLDPIYLFPVGYTV